VTLPTRVYALTSVTAGLAFPRAAVHLLATRHRADLLLDIHVTWKFDGVFACRKPSAHYFSADDSSGFESSTTRGTSAHMSIKKK